MVMTKSAPTGGKARSKSQLIGEISTQTGLSRKEVTSVFDALTTCIQKDMSKRGPGLFTVPGLMKIKRIHKPATKARMGRNPFTGEDQMFKAKPARSVVKVLALKNLKAMV